VIGMAWATLIMAAACFSSFAIGIRFYFVKPAKKTLPMYLVTEVGFVISLLHLGLLAHRGVWHQLLDKRALAGAIALYAGSLILYSWALRTVLDHRLTFAYTKDMPKVLIDAGPYRYVRHPFYTAYTMCYLAAPVALMAWWLLPTVVFMFLVYRQSAVMEERKFAGSELQAAYSDYAGRTGRFLPRLFRSSRR
jgi:protein-S-isoprenylcysteine O-methyltransferase Ste14